jgi:hypothetical protein
MEKESTCGGIKFFNIENYEAYKEIIKDMTCCVCLYLIKKPVECTLCQTLICDDCMQILTMAGKKCIVPKCGGEYKKANKFVREVLSNLKIICEYCMESFKYNDFNTHLDKCTGYTESEQYRLLKTIKESDEKINSLKKEIESSSRNMLKSKIELDPYANYSKEELRRVLVTFLLPVNQKMELYNSCVEGKLEEFKNLVLNKKYSVLEEVSAHNYYWTPFHYAMHYGQWEIVNFICSLLKSKNLLDAAMRLESNDGRCPLMCLLKSNSIAVDKKSVILSKFLCSYKINLSPEVKREISTRNFDNLLPSNYR